MIEAHVKTKSGDKKIIAYDINEFNPPVLAFKPLQRNHKIKWYATDYMVLDTETSHIDDSKAWVYQWAVKFKSTYIYGRKPSEFIQLLTYLAEAYQLRGDKKIIMYIHNSAYDLQFLKHYLKEYDPTIDFFMLDNHSILICEVLGFRIVCSYKLTNLSLAALSKNYANKYIKASGEIDYKLIRYQDSELNEKDWYYMFSDVAAQYDGIRGYLDTMGYKYAYEAPFTSTGFVRGDCRKASRATDDWRKEFQISALNLEQYNLCRWGFMGGVCIASFLYAGQTIRSDDLGHLDFRSSYPCSQLTDYMPKGKPMWFGPVDDMDTFRDLLNTFCCVFVFTAHEIHIKPGVTAPAIPSSKCVGLKEPVRINGKVVYAKELSIAITELDFYWIEKQYTFEGMQIRNMLIFERGEVPEWFRREVMTYYKQKQSLKHENPLLYAKSKNFLNGIYGMTATALIRPDINMDEDLIASTKDLTPEERTKEDESKLRKYYKSYNNFMPYQYALWTTARSRYRLYEMIEAAGYENFLYCDTDSIFYIKTPENEKRMQIFKEECIKRAIDHHAYIGTDYLGEPTTEPPIRAFRALHSKCYAMEELNEKSGEYELKVVIAGIPKKATKWVKGKPITITNAEELGSIDNLADGFKFEHCGGTRAIYLEDPKRIEFINGHKTELASSVIIEDIEKVISDTMYSIENNEFINMLLKYD